MRGGLGGRLASASVRSTTAAAVPEQNRSFSLWARHPAETSAELNVRLGAAEFFPVASRQVRRVRKRRREGNARAARVERRYTIQRANRWVSRTAVRWGPQFSSSAPDRKR